MTNEEVITKRVEQDEDFCIITDEVNGTVNIEVSLDWWKKQSNSDKDCISRQATVERLCKVADFMNEKRSGLGSPYIMAALFIQDNKDEFPSVTPKPKTDVLDKIRAEIIELRSKQNVGVLECLDIIDKYKVEKE